jgi:hypothetical protein
MKLTSVLRLSLGSILLAALSACGGGGSSSAVATPAPSVPTVAVNYLTKYQGTWIEQCSRPIQYNATTFGPSSTREKFVISAPDASGKITIDYIQEFFNTTVGCYDYAAKPLVTVTETVPSTATFSRVESLFYIAGNLDHDVLQVSQATTAVTAIGVPSTSVSQATVSKAQVWRITFSDGKTVDISTANEASSGEAALLLRSVNNVQNQLVINLGNANPTIYSKQ